MTLMKDVDNPVCVHSSKAIGEPPFFLATSAFFAIKDAIRAYRRQEVRTPLVLGLGLGLGSGGVGVGPSSMRVWEGLGTHLC